MKGNLVYTLDLTQITLKDLPLVGGKNASWGELFNALNPKSIGALDGYAVGSSSRHTSSWNEG